MMRFTSVVLPAPVGPTIATVCPGMTENDRSRMSGCSGLYENATFSNTIVPSPSTGAGASAASGCCSSESRSSKTRSADAVPDCTTAAMPPSSESGCVNCCEYWMKACTSPSRSWPLATISPPSTAMPTNDRLPMNIMPGMIMPERNCALKLAR